MGIVEVSRVRLISRGFSCSEIGDPPEGEGDKTIDGARPCLFGMLNCGCGFVSIGDGEGAVEAGESDIVAVAEVDVGLEGSQSKPGFTIRLTVSPSCTLYSFKSFPPASAFPLSKRRWVSDGGAPDCVASCDLMDEIESVSWTEREYDLGGLVDLKVI